MGELLGSIAFTLIVIAVIVSLAMLFYIRYIPAAAWFVLVLLGLQLGGAIGNVIDRIAYGYVTDFVKLGILKELTHQRRNRLFIFEDYVRLFRR